MRNHINKSHKNQKMTPIQKNNKRKLKQLSNNSLKKSLDNRSIKNSNTLTFHKIVNNFDEILTALPDNRTGNNNSIQIRDAALAAFSVFFLQNPSFLEFQTTMQKTKGKNNAQSLLGVYKIPSDNHIRNLLDEVNPNYLAPMFSFITQKLQTSGYLDEFRSYNNNLLIALDGSQYFSSRKIRCDDCNRKTEKNGSINYFHSLVSPVLVQPGNNKVVTFFPEHITQQDGHEKQDCERAAAKRWVLANDEKLEQLAVTITGDDLYCNQPFCDLLLEKNLDFILVCKPESHKTLYEYLELLKEDIQTVTVRRWTGRRYLIDTYRFLDGLPLRDGKDALEVNWCQLVTTCEDSGKTVYKNAFVTNFEISKKNVKQIVADGRARWKIENEAFNVLKNRGYHLEHNFGHGKKNLSKLLVTLNMLAFLVHTVLDLMDERYRLIREVLPSRKRFFNDLRALTCYIYFDSWDDLMIFMIHGLELQDPGNTY